MTTAVSSTSSNKSDSSDEDLQQLLTPRISRYCPHAPTEQQTLALIAHRFLPDDEPSELFYGGAAGGGKSDWLLMAALEYVDIPGYSAILFRRTFTDLELPGAIMDRARAWLAPYVELGEVHWHEQKKRFTFPSGAKLQFAYLKDAGDELRYQSAEFQMVGFDELTQFPEGQYTYLFSRLRRPETGPLATVPLRMRSASNPGGIGHGWVKKRFPVDGRPRGSRVFIPAKIADNPHLDAVSYRNSLSRLGETLQQQLEHGDWNVAEGLAFNVTPASLIDDLEIPKGWERFESMDFGVSNPTCVLAWAADYDGNSVIFDSYYQGDTLVSDHAKAIEAHRAIWKTELCYADPSMWAKNGRRTSWGDPATDVTEFQEHGIGGLVQANNKRRPGRVRLAELLKADPEHLFPSWHPQAGESGAPRLYIVADRCPDLVDQLQTAPLNDRPIDGHGAGEVVDPAIESADLHAVAAARYGAMSRPAPSVKPREVLDPKAEILRRHIESLDRQSLEPSSYMV